MIAETWRDQRTLLLGLLVLGLALAEGAAGDWVALALADGHGQSDAAGAAGAAGYGLFVTFMDIGRFAGTHVLDRFGRVPVMRWCAALAVLGLLAEHVGILHSLLAVMVMLVMSFLLAPVARKIS